MGASNSKSSSGKKKKKKGGRRLSEDYTTIEDETGYGCDLDSLSHSETQNTLALCGDAAYAMAPDVVAYQYSGGQCYMYDVTCFAGPRPTEVTVDGVTSSRGNLFIFYEATPGYVAYLEETEYYDSVNVTVEEGTVTPGTMFVRMDSNKNGLVDEDEVAALSYALGNPDDSGFSFKGAFLSSGSFATFVQDDVFNCRDPYGNLDYGEMYDIFHDTTEQCYSTGNADSVRTKFARQKMLSGFLGFDEPACPTVDYPSPPPAPPPAPCSPYDSSTSLTEEMCGPWEESFALPYGSPTVITTLTMDATLDSGAQYAACLSACCEQTYNDVYGNDWEDDPCSGATYVWSTLACTLYTGDVTLVPGTSLADGESATVISASLLPIDEEPYSRRKLGGALLAAPEPEDDEDDEEDGETLEEPRAPVEVGFNDSHPAIASHRALLDEPSMPHSASSLSSAANLALVLAPMVALLVGVLGGRPLKAHRAKRAAQREMEMTAQ